MRKELFNTKLSRKLEKDEIFLKLFDLLNNLAIKVDLKFGYNEENISFMSVKDLIQYWFIFASSELDEHKQIALRISYVSYVLINELWYEKNIIDYKDILQLLLSRLWNNVSLPLILWQKKNNINYDETLFWHLETSNIPINEKISVLKNMSENLFKIKEESEWIILNDSQTELIQIFNENKYISFSWPTSFWKTFLLINYILKDILIEKEDSTYIFVLPTISLLSEIKWKFQKELIESNIFNDTLLSSNPKISENDEEINYKNKIFIFTQERLSSFLVNQEDVKIKVLIVDEAYNIEDLNRGIILLDWIKTVLNKSNDTKIIFSSPLLDNPEKFFEIFNLEKSKQHKKVSISPVLQNKIWVYCNSNTWNVDFYIHKNDNREKESIKSINLTDDFSHTKLEKVSSISKSDINVYKVLKNIELKWTTFIFVQDPKNMINLAKHIINDKNVKLLDNKYINETSIFLKDLLHNDFSLAESIKYGVIYYFGDLPSIVKDKLAFLIDKWLIKYIISNQALIQWVNFPIKNIVIKLKWDLKWISKNVNELDFKNLIWRAWRLLEDFAFIW